MGELNQFHPLSLCLYPLERGGSYLDGATTEHDHVSRTTGLSFILLPLSFLFKGETRAPFFPLHPCLNAPSPRRFW